LRKRLIGCIGRHLQQSCPSPLCQERLWVLCVLLVGVLENKYDLGNVTLGFWGWIG
jgi:hypothetical protein